MFIKLRDIQINLKKHHILFTHHIQQLLQPHICNIRTIPERQVRQNDVVPQRAAQLLKCPVPERILVYSDRIETRVPPKILTQVVYVTILHISVGKVDCPDIMEGHELERGQNVAGWFVGDV